MQKSVKGCLIVFGSLVSIILLDTLQARIFKHSPIISWKEDLADKDSWVDRGILIDTFYCTKEQDIITVSWHLKTSKFTCPIDDAVLKVLNDVNNEIIKYFSSDEANYDNYSFNYVDEENKVVVVGLLDNSKEQQSEFKKTVLDSEYISFVRGVSNVDYRTIKEELINIRDKITGNVSSKEKYSNFASCYVDEENEVVVVELVDNSEEQQDWFRKNIMNSKYIKFTQGGPYTTTDN